MTVTVRIAPSPTGRLTFGNLRAAVFNWLYARKHGGHFLLRIDDTDTARSTKEMDEAIQEDLRWLGVTWDKFARQSERLPRYAEVIAQLKAAGRLYPCYETEEELGLKRKSLLGRGLPPVYDRAALKLTATEVEKFEAEGRQPHWRFLLKDHPVEWDDGVRGKVSIPVRELSDPVLLREDGSLLYTLASCVDDMDLNITDIIRGEDHVTNTAPQIQIMHAISAGTYLPRFAHFPHITGKEGEKLSKRLGSFGIPEIRNELQVEPISVWCVLGRLGTSEPVEALQHLDQLVDSFDLSKVSRTPPKFDPEDLLRLNARILHHMPWNDVQDRLKALGFADMDEEFWTAVRPNITHLAEVKDWWHIAREVIPGAVTDTKFAAQAAALLPSEPWDATTWENWIAAIKSATGRKGKDLFMPLRLALTGREHGPELKALLPLIGRARAIDRMNGKAA